MFKLTPLHVPGLLHAVVADRLAIAGLRHVSSMAIFDGNPISTGRVRLLLVVYACDAAHGPLAFSIIITRLTRPVGRVPEDE